MNEESPNQPPAPPTAPVPEPAPSAAAAAPASPRKPRKPAAKKAVTPKAVTQFPFPSGTNTCELQNSRKGRKLSDAMLAYTAPRLLRKLKARSRHNPWGNRHDCVTIAFRDACVIIYSWLGCGDIYSNIKFPLARLYPIKGGYYNLALRRPEDWELVEEAPLSVGDDAFWNQAPNAKFWIKSAQHKTFEECIDLLVKDRRF